MAVEYELLALDATGAGQAQIYLNNGKTTMVAFATAPVEDPTMFHDYMSQLCKDAEMTAPLAPPKKTIHPGVEALRFNKKIVAKPMP